MKKVKVLFMVIFILLFASCGKPREVNIKDTEEKDGITYVKGESKGFTGIIKDYYDNENLKIEMTFKAGKKDGSSKIYYENGNLKVEGNYKDNKLEGLSKRYYENGNLEIEVSYKDGKADGISKTYYPNGNLKVEVLFKDDKIVY